MDDFQIIQQVLGGNRSVYKELIIRHQKSLFGFLLGFGVRREIVEEIAQDVFAQAFFKLKTYDDNKSRFSTWLFTIAKNKALTVLKSAKNKNEILSAETEVSEVLTPLHQLEKNQNLIQINRALAQLPTEYRSTVILFYVNELSLKEISILEKCSEGTVKSRLFRAKEIMRKHLEKGLGYEKSV